MALGGWLQWGSEICAITSGALEELAQAKAANPYVNFKRLAVRVRENSLKPMKGY